MNLPQISIVTPSFNQGKFIEQTIQSVLDQGYPNLQYIIIDGGSTDETLHIIKKYEKHLTYWVSEPDRGQSHAINKGLQKCTGQVFNWLNSDDFLEPGSLKHIGHEFARKPYAALCGRVHVWDDTVFSHVRKPSYVGPTTEDSIAAFNINQEGTWWNLDLVKKLGGVNEGLHFCMDLELWFRMLLSAPITSFRKTETALSNFRRHPAAKSTAEGQKGNKSPFLAEQAVLFENMKPGKAKWNYANLLGIEAMPTFKLEYLFYSLTKPQKRRITNKRLFYLAKERYYRGEWETACQILEKIGFFPKGVNVRDYFFLRRVMRKNKWKI